MKMSNNKNGQVVVGIQQEKFKVNNEDSIIYDILTNMYTDPLGSVIRELGTNAKDSHIQAGKEIPFDVIFPTIIDDSLIIKDYGVGLSKEELKEIYLVYLKSTKRDTNDLTGCLGIGSKTPFIISDVMIVTAVRNGYKNMLQCGFNNDIPDYCWLIDNQPTDEENGVEVKIPLQQNYSAETIAQKIKEQYKFFDIKPNIINYDNKDIEYIDKSESIMKMTDTISLSNKIGNSVVVMNEIGYPISLDELIEAAKAAECDFSEQLKMLSQYETNASIIFNIDSGLVKFNPSRESLILNKYTVNNIINTFNKYIYEVEHSDILINIFKEQNDYEKIKQYWLSLYQYQYETNMITSLLRKHNIPLGDITTQAGYKLSSIAEAIEKTRLMEIRNGNVKYIVDSDYEMNYSKKKIVRDSLNSLFTIIDKNAIPRVRQSLVATWEITTRLSLAIIVDKSFGNGPDDYEMLTSALRGSRWYVPPIEPAKKIPAIRKKSNDIKFPEYPISGIVKKPKTYCYINNEMCVKNQHVYVDPSDLEVCLNMLSENPFSEIASLIGYNRIKLISVKNTAANIKAINSINAINWNNFIIEFEIKIKQYANNIFAISPRNNINVNKIENVLHKYKELMISSTISDRNYIKRLLIKYNNAFNSSTKNKYLPMSKIHTINRLLSVLGSKFTVKYKSIDKLYPEFKSFESVMTRAYPLLSNATRYYHRMNEDEVDYITMVDKYNGYLSTKKYNQLKSNVIVSNG